MVESDWLLPFLLTFAHSSPRCSDAYWGKGACECMYHLHYMEFFLILVFVLSVTQTVVFIVRPMCGYLNLSMLRSLQIGGIRKQISLSWLECSNTVSDVSVGPHLDHVALSLFRALCILFSKVIILMRIVPKDSWRLPFSCTKNLIWTVNIRCCFWMFVEYLRRKHFFLGCK